MSLKTKKYHKLSKEKPEDPQTFLIEGKGLKHKKAVIVTIEDLNKRKTNLKALLNELEENIQECQKL